MLKLIKRLFDQWSSWVGDRDLEIAIRTELSRRGWRGSSARFSQFRLAAVRRPGWLQIFTFEVLWDSPHLDGKHLDGKQPCSVFGLVRQDERFDRLEIEFFESAPSRNEEFLQWSDGMHRLRQRRPT